MPKSLKQQTPLVATGGATALFTLIKAPNGTNKRVHFQGDESLSDRIDRLTDILYRMDMDGKPNKKPYKPYIQTQEDKDGAVSSDKEEVILEAIELRDGPDLKVDLEVEEVDSPTEEVSREESLTKALPPKDPKNLAKLRIKTKIDAIIAISEDTLQWSAQRKTRVKPQNPLRERNLKIILMLIVGQKNLSWLWPQPYPKPMRMHWLS